MDFTKLDMATLKRYKRHYRLKTRQNVTKTELALAVAKHFASQHVDEVRPPAARAPAFAAARPDIHRLAWQAETIQLFVYSARSSTLHYGACPARRKKASPPALAEPQPRHAQASAPALLRCAPCHTWQTVATTSMAMGDDLLARFNVCDSYGMALDPTVQPHKVDVWFAPYVVARGRTRVCPSVAVCVRATVSRVAQKRVCECVCVPAAACV